MKLHIEEKLIRQYNKVKHMNPNTMNSLSKEQLDDLSENLLNECETLIQKTESIVSADEIHGKYNKLQNIIDKQMNVLKLKHLARLSNLSDIEANTIVEYIKTWYGLYFNINNQSKASDFSNKLELEETVDIENSNRKLYIVTNITSENLEFSPSFRLTNKKVYSISANGELTLTPLDLFILSLRPEISCVFANCTVSFNNKDWNRGNNAVELILK